MNHQTTIDLPAFPRGFHLITHFIEAELKNLPATGVLHLFLQHTSAGLMINENADYTVRQDFEQVLNRLVPENQPWYRHRSEGSDDLPAHIKSAIAGISVSIPITSGKLNLGMWQGIYLCEFRNSGGRRRIVATVTG